MATLNLGRARAALQDFDWSRLFIEELGWLQPPAPRAFTLSVAGSSVTLTRIAQIGGVVALEVGTEADTMPDSKQRAAIQKRVAEQHYEHVLIFTAQQRSQSLWYWVKRENKKRLPREHSYFKGQPGDLFLSKLAALAVDLAELKEHGDMTVTQAKERLQQALDIEKTTKKFFKEFQEQHARLLTHHIQGIENERDKKWYGSVLLNRLMFVYFLQAKGFLNHGELRYLQKPLESAHSLPLASGTEGIFTEGYAYYEVFLKTLFFEGFAKPESERSEAAKSLLGFLPYLNGGLFLPHDIEKRWPSIRIPDQAFVELLQDSEPKGLFARYSWQLDDTPGGKDDEINPDTLGYIFEKYINQKAFGAYYTRPEITTYLCEQTIHRLVLDRVEALGGGRYESVQELLFRLDAPQCQRLLNEVLPNLTLLDPACGSGAFLVAAMRVLIAIYTGVTGKIEYTGDRELRDWLAQTRKDHRSLYYHVKKKIITENLYGVDIMPEALEIAKLRLFLALVSSALTVEELEPLPNIDFNLLSGNALIGLMRVNDKEFDTRHAQGDLFKPRYGELVETRDRMVGNYKSLTSYVENLSGLKEAIQKEEAAANLTLDEVLLDEFRSVGVKWVEQATWDDAKDAEGKAQKRPLDVKDIRKLEPFHWGYEFDQVLNKKGGFDAIIANPPWDIFKPNSKEFLQQHDAGITINNTGIKEFEERKAELMKDKSVRSAWLDYLSSFPHVSLYYRSSPEYANQISEVNGKKTGSDINLYKLFVERCYHLLREGGQCGLVIPSGIYTDLGTKQLRHLLFTKAQIKSLFGLANERYLFEGVHHAFKICILTIAKELSSKPFTAGFRINPREAISKDNIEFFLRNHEDHVQFTSELIHSLSPDSLSIPEFKNEVDAKISNKALQFPRLGEYIKGTWNFVLGREMDMTNDSHLFKSEMKIGFKTLYEGKMVHQFNIEFAKPRYWIDEKEGRDAILGNRNLPDQILEYQKYRLVFRDVARSSDERTMIASILNPGNFIGNTLIYEKMQPEAEYKLFFLAVLDSFAYDYFIRHRVSAHCNMFYVYSVQVPRLTAFHPWFWPLVDRAAQLTCTTPEFDDLTRQVEAARKQKGYKVVGATDFATRGRLRAEIDGIVAHLYGLTEEEFAYVLTTFPLVPDPVKLAARNAFRDVANGLYVPPLKGNAGE